MFSSWKVINQKAPHLAKIRFSFAKLPEEVTTNQRKVGVIINFRSKRWWGLGI